MISLQRVVGFLLLKSCLMALAKTSAFPLPPFLVYCCEPRTIVSVPPTDSYDDGYQDGEAMAEEDRLAGKPGMQVGMDDDDEEYEDGFDDGYDE